MKDSNYLTNISSQTWQLWVPKPLMGSRYSLKWTLPEKMPGAGVSAMINEASEFRERVLQHGGACRVGQNGDDFIRIKFLKLAESLKKRYGLVPAAGESFEVSLMTYDEKQRRLLTCGFLLSGENLMEKDSGRIWLPYGFGLAGTAFKECDKIHLYKRTANPDIHRPSPYIPVEGSLSHEVLLSIPFEHPAVWQLPLEDELFQTLDRPRTCLGVLNLGSNSPNSPLKRDMSVMEGLRLRARLQAFAAKLFNQPTTNGTMIASEEG
jgi:hypothetical protein